MKSGGLLLLLLLPVTASLDFLRVAFRLCPARSFQVARQLVQRFPCLSISVSQAPVDRGTIILGFAQCSARPNFAPPLASDRALSVLTAPQSHWDLSAPSFPSHHAHCALPQNTHADTIAHAYTPAHLFFTVCLFLGGREDDGWKWKVEQRLSTWRKKQRSEHICRDAQDNGILCP